MTAFSNFDSPFDQQEADMQTIGSEANIIGSEANIIGSEAATTSEAPTPLDASQYGTIPSEKYTPVDWADFDPSMFDHLGLDNLGSIEDGLDAGLLAAESDRQRTEQIGAIGLDRGSFTDDEFSSNTAYFDKYVPKQEEFKQGQRDALTDLFATDSEQFGTVFEQLGANSKLNFLEGQYSAGSLAKDKYLELAQQVLGGNTDSDNQYFIKGEKLYEVSNTFANDPSALSHSREVILFDNQKLITNNKRLDETQLFRDAIGSTNYESANTGSKWVKARDNVLRPLANITASIATGGMSSAVETAIRGVSGETLHAGDWATLGVAGLEAAGLISPPVDGASAAGPAGVGPVMPSTGVGLGGLTYNQTAALINGAASGDAAAAVVGMFGDQAIDAVLGSATDSDKRLLGMFQSDDARAALKGFVADAAEGKTLDRAALSSLHRYIEEGGGLGLDGSMDWADFDIGPLQGLLSDLSAPIRAVTSAAGALIEDVAQVAGDVLEPAGGVIEDAAQIAGDVVEDVAQVTGDLAEDLAQAIGDLAPDVDIDLPDLDLDVDLDVDSPDVDIDLPTTSPEGQQQAAPRPSPTRTTDELFKFGTKIRSTQEMIDFSADPFAPDYRGL